MPLYMVTGLDFTINYFMAVYLFLPGHFSFLFYVLFYVSPDQ